MIASYTVCKRSLFDRCPDNRRSKMGFARLSMPLPFCVRHYKHGCVGVVIHSCRLVCSCPLPIGAQYSPVKVRVLVVATIPRVQSTPSSSLRLAENSKFKVLRKPVPYSRSLNTLPSPIDLGGRMQRVGGWDFKTMLFGDDGVDAQHL